MSVRDGRQTECDLNSSFRSSDLCLVPVALVKPCESISFVSSFHTCLFVM